MDGINDYLARKAQQLGLDRADTLSKIQHHLDRRYAGGYRAASIQDGVLRITTRSASAASELRFKQVELKRQLDDLGVEGVKRIVVQIR